jgi:hypothetical protein
VGYLDDLEAEGLISAAIKSQIREAYPVFLNDLKRRQSEGERLPLADLIAFQFLLDKSSHANSQNNPPLVRSFSPEPEGRAYKSLLESIATRLDTAA